MNISHLNMGPDGVSVTLLMKRTPFSSSHSVVSPAGHKRSAVQ
jgi:hypothetical protein